MLWPSYDRENTRSEDSSTSYTYTRNSVEPDPHVKAVFNLADRNHDGVLDRGEFNAAAAAYVKAMPEPRRSSCVAPLSDQNGRPSVRGEKADWIHVAGDRKRSDVTDASIRGKAQYLYEREAKLAETEAAIAFREEAATAHEAEMFNANLRRAQWEKQLTEVARAQQEKEQILKDREAALRADEASTATQKLALQQFFAAEEGIIQEMHACAWGSPIEPQGFEPQGSVQAIFDAADRNHDGVVDRGEFNAAFGKAAPWVAEANTLQAMGSDVAKLHCSVLAKERETELLRSQLKSSDESAREVQSLRAQLAVCEKRAEQELEKVKFKLAAAEAECSLVTEHDQQMTDKVKHLSQQLQDTLHQVELERRRGERTHCMTAAKMDLAVLDADVEERLNHAQKLAEKRTELERWENSLAARTVDSCARSGLPGGSWIGWLQSLVQCGRRQHYEQGVYTAWPSSPQYPFWMPSPLCE